MRTDFGLRGCREGDGVVMMLIEYHYVGQFPESLGDRMGRVGYATSVDYLREIVCVRYSDGSEYQIPARFLSPADRVYAQVADENDRFYRDILSSI